MTFLSDLLSHTMAAIAAELASPLGWIAYFAVAVATVLVIVSSFVKTMIPLRWLAVGSNVGFAVYGLLHPSLPTLLLGIGLLPINVYRAIEMTRLTRQVKAASDSGDQTGVWLKPYMKSRRFAAGHSLFRKGDVADHLYYLSEGRIELVEIGQFLEPGSIFGEIAFFAPDRKRTLTARCVGPCRVLSIDDSTVKQLYYQNPAFGFQLIGLVAGRLSADVQRLQRPEADQTSTRAG